MSGSLNQAQLIGNLGKDPDMRRTATGQAVATLNLATNETWKEGDEKKERVEWHRCVAWGKLAELCGEHLSKGDTIYVSGRIQTREWVDKEGIKRYATEIVCAEVKFLRTKKQGQSKASTPPVPSDADAPRASTPKRNPHDFGPTPEDFGAVPNRPAGEEEIPF